MTKYEWEKKLRKELKNLPEDEKARIAEYYNELFEDKIDEGFKEDKIVESFGEPKLVAEKILSDYNAYLNRAEEEEERTFAGTDTAKKSDFREKEEPEEKPFVYDREPAKTESFAPADGGKYANIRKLKIDVCASDVSIVRGAKFDLKMQESEGTRYEVDAGGDTLFIKEKTKNVIVNMFGFGLKNRELVIVLPALESINFNAVKCGCKIHGFDLKRATLTTVKGSLKIEDCSVGYGSLTTTAGDVTIDGGSHGSITATSMSGDIRVRDMSAEELSVASTGGDIQCVKARVDKKCALRTMGGDISSKRVECENAEYKTFSGDIEIELERETREYTLKLRSVSGSVKAPSSLGGKYCVTASTFSGEIIID